MNFRTFFLTMICGLIPFGGCTRVSGNTLVDATVATVGKGSTIVQPADSASFMLVSPKTTIALTLASIALLESPRIAGVVKACAKKVWDGIKPTVAVVAKTISSAGIHTFLASVLAGKLCSSFNLGFSIGGKRIDKNTLYSLSAAALPISYLAYRIAEAVGTDPQPQRPQPRGYPVVRNCGACSGQQPIVQIGQLNR